MSKDTTLCAGIDTGKHKLDVAIDGGSARIKNQPAAVGNDRGLRSIVSGLLFTMSSATPTCRGLSARSADPHLSGVGHAWSGVTAKLRSHADFAMVCASAVGR
jgi:hypothetical protein